MADSFGLYVVLTAPVVGYEACAQACVREGVAIIQLRMKNEPPARMLQVARAVRKVTLGSSTLFIVNDDVRLAAQVDADGLHLGQDDMGLEEARRLWNEPGKVYGLSTHSLDQARASVALEPDYIGVGPVWTTPTKPAVREGLGTRRAAEMAGIVPFPAVAIGGIDARRLPELRQAGIENYAVVRAVCQATDPAEAIRQLRRAEQKPSAV